MNKVRNYRDLEIWKFSMEIVEEIYLITKSFPKEEMFGLISQMRRCSVSIPSNIAEGSSRKYDKEFKHFLYIALGSCSELETQIEISYRLKLIEEQKNNVLIEKTNHITRMISSLIKCL